MRRLLLVVPAVALLSALGCGRLCAPTVRESAGPSLQEVARALPVPQGYVAQKAPSFFKRDNLYEAIDGQDGEYMSYGCVGMALVEWAKSKDAQEKIQAELSDMGTALGAFGMYSRAHVGKGEFANIGGEEAAVGEDSVELARGRFYVRLMGPPDTCQPLESLARTFVAKVPPGPRVEQLTAALPGEDRVASSERWIPDSAFGMNFLRNVLAARYQVGGKTVELYLAPFADASAARSALETFRETRKERTPQPATGGFPGFTYSDEWLGKIGVFQIGARLAVIVGYEPNPPVEALLRKIEAPQHPASANGDRRSEP